MVDLVAYLFYFVASSASTLQRRWLAVNKNITNEGQLQLAFQAFAITAVGGLLIPFFVPFVLTGDPLKLVLLTIGAGVFGAGFFWASYTAQKHVEAGVTTLLGNSYTPIAIILSTLFLHEALKPLQLVGTALLLAGIVVVSKKHQTGKFKFDRYFWLMLASGVMLGVSLTCERALQIETGFTAGTLLSWWAQFVALGIATQLARSKHQYSVSDVATTGVMRLLQSLSWVVLIFTVGNLSLVSAVTTFKVVVVFAAAALFLNEREDLGRKILGSFIALAGLLLMK